MPTRVRQTEKKVTYRLWVGRAAHDFLEGDQGRIGTSKQPNYNGAVRHLGWTDTSSKKEFLRLKAFVKRCCNLFKQTGAHAGNDPGNHCIGGRQIPTWYAVPDSARLRIRGNQGRPRKSPELSYALYQWFADIRMSIAGKSQAATYSQWHATCRQN